MTTSWNKREYTGITWQDISDTWAQATYSWASLAGITWTKRTEPTTSYTERTEPTTSYTERTEP